MIPPRLLPASLHLAIECASYPVTGSSASGIRTVVHALGPTRDGRTFAAFTDWEVSWTYSVAPLPEGVHLAAVRVAVRAVVTLPRWLAPRSAPAMLAESWGRYLAAVEIHEQGHVNLATEAGRSVLAGLEALPAFLGAEDLRHAVDATAGAAVAAARDRERAYDDVTGHGATQGVRLDGGAPIPLVE